MIKFGYKGDTKVYVLRKENERMTNKDGEETPILYWDFVSARMDDIKPDEYILMICMRDFSGVLINGMQSMDYAGEMENIITEGKRRFSFCADSKQLAFRLPEGVRIPLIDERMLEDFGEDECFGVQSGMSRCMADRKVEEGSLEDILKFYGDPNNIHMGVDIDRMESRITSYYEGKLYNVECSSEYAFATENGILLKTEH